MYVQVNINKLHGVGSVGFSGCGGRSGRRCRRCRARSEHDSDIGLR